MGDILRRFSVDRQNDRVRLQADQLSSAKTSYELVNSLRASFFSIGPCSAASARRRFPTRWLPHGARPVVEHIRGLKALGAHVSVEHGIVRAAVPGSQQRLKGASIVFDCPSVEPRNVLMAAVLAEGTTILENAAQEPEVQDQPNCSTPWEQRSQAQAGQPSQQGVPRLHGVSNYPALDRIEAGTFLIAAAITGSSMRIEPVIPEHINAVLQNCGIADVNWTLITKASQSPLAPCRRLTSPHNRSRDFPLTCKPRSWL